MNAASIIRAQGARPSIDEGGNLALNLSNVPKSLRADVVALAKRHKAELIEYVKGLPAIPPHITSALADAGYSPPEWTPASCRAFLDRLREEWPVFQVRSWSGLTMPHAWPPAFRDAVQSIYIRSIQDR